MKSPEPSGLVFLTERHEMPPVRTAGPSAAGDVRRDGQPPTLTASPNVGVAARAQASVRSGERRARVDDGHVAHDADVDVVTLEVRYRDRMRRLPEKRLPADQRSIRITAEEVVRKDLIEASHVRRLHGADVVTIEAPENREIRLGRRGCLHLILP